MLREAGLKSDTYIDYQDLDDKVLELLQQKEPETDPVINEKLEKELYPEVRSFILENTELNKDSCVALLKTSSAFNLRNLPDCAKSADGYNLLVNLKTINDTLMINELFVSINKKLAPKGVFVGCVETYPLRKRRLLNKYWKGFNYLYYFFDYIFKRVFPKVVLLDKFYFFITAGRNRAISETEALGRLNYSGFTVINTLVHKNYMYFVTQKVNEVVAVKEKSYGIFLKLPRKGKGGKTIYVNKFRTMFPYAEYVQDYVYKKNQLSEGGKFRNDFRVSLLGSYFRKFFIDELPMLLNLLNGDLKLVGVRPLSNHYFGLYSEELQEKRIKHKPGLIPPYYVDLPKTLEEIQASEMRYLEAYEKSPIKTDVKYFFLVFKNILFKKARSK